MMGGVGFRGWGCERSAMGAENLVGVGCGVWGVGCGGWGVWGEGCGVCGVWCGGCGVWRFELTTRASGFKVDNKPFGIGCRV